jgi:dihydrofolate reductase
MKVTCLMALTLDGKIGLDAEHFPDWTGKADKKLFVEMTKKAGVLIMGSKTYDTIGKPLPGRKNIVLTRDKARVSDHEDLIFTNNMPAQILKNCEAQGFSEVIIAGGTTINSLFAREKLIDRLVVTISPVIFGKGLGLFGEDIALDLTLEDYSQLDENRLCVSYKVMYE